MDNQQLLKLYGRLKGMKEYVTPIATIDKSTGDDYNSIVKQAAEITGESLDSFLLPHDSFFTGGNNRKLCRPQVIIPKLLQFISFLEEGYLKNPIVEIGSIYNSITDSELKARCSDILSAQDNFDRVINQATLILEDRIRTKAKQDRTFIGANLVNRAIHSDLSKTILIMSHTPEIQEGIGHICRGIMLAYRNPTHHSITDCSREEALKVCAFVDTILQLIDKAQVVNS